MEPEEHTTFLRGLITLATIFVIGMCIGSCFCCAGCATTHRTIILASHENLRQACYDCDELLKIDKDNVYLIIFTDDGLYADIHFSASLDGAVSLDKEMARRFAGKKFKILVYIPWHKGYKWEWDNPFFYIYDEQGKVLVKW